MLTASLLHLPMLRCETPLRVFSGGRGTLGALRCVTAILPTQLTLLWESRA